MLKTVRSSMDGWQRPGRADVAIGIGRMPPNLIQDRLPFPMRRCGAGGSAQIGPACRNAAVTPIVVDFVRLNRLSRGWQQLATQCAYPIQGGLERRNALVFAVAFRHAEVEDVDFKCIGHGISPGLAISVAAGPDQRCSLSAGTWATARAAFRGGQPRAPAIHVTACSSVTSVSSSLGKLPTMVTT
jgi:hypothetical protein